MSSKKSKKKINGGDIIKNMFGGMDIKNLGTQNYIIIILVSCIVLTGIVVFTKPHIDRLFKPSDENTKSSQKIDETLKTFLEKLKNEESFINLIKKICAT